MRIKTSLRFRDEREVLNMASWLSGHRIDMMSFHDVYERGSHYWRTKEIADNISRIASSDIDDVFGVEVEIPDEDLAAEFLLRFS